MKIPYENQTDRDLIISTQADLGFVLVKDQLLLSGKFLIFDTVSNVARLQLSVRDKSGEDIRVLEDLVDTLIAKGLITEADLPQGAKDKLTKRREIRERITPS